jgi:hypothetical protein
MCSTLCPPRSKHDSRCVPRSFERNGFPGGGGKGKGGAYPLGVCVGDVPGDHAAPVVAHHHGLLIPQRRDQTHHVRHQRLTHTQEEHRVRSL